MSPNHGGPSANLRVLYPGSFDPVHNGHIDVVETAARLFDEVVVAAMRNPGKAAPLFDFEERESLLNEVFSHLPGVRTVLFSGLVVDLAQSLEVDFILKGLRQVSDFESELLMAQTNKAVSGIETLFLPTDPSNSFISSKYIREIARFGGKVDTMVPPVVLARLHTKFGVANEVAS